MTVITTLLSQNPVSFCFDIEVPLGVAGFYALIHKKLDFRFPSARKETAHIGCALTGCRVELILLEASRGFLHILAHCCHNPES